MPYGLRFYTRALSIGTYFDYFVPDQDMPEMLHKPYRELFEDINVTPSGNTWLYEKGSVKKWELTFGLAHTITKNAIEQCVYGWHKQQQITIVAFGTSVVGSVTTWGSLNTAGQVWGTGYVRFVKSPEEEFLDLWNFSILITEFGTNQAFT